MHVSHFTAIWEFHLKPDSISAFEGIYGPDGAWAQLFRRSPDYLGTELLRDLNHPGRYLTLDHWISGEALHQFKQDHHAAYDALDTQCESLTEHEALLGEFESLVAPDAT
jgi:quinol monooxygenase YgiN